MEDQTIVFLDSLCEEATKRRKAGDWSVMRIIATSPAVQYYHDNVYSMGVNPKSFMFTGMFHECKAFHQAYLDEKNRERIVDETPTRLNTLEEQIKHLTELITPIVEHMQTEPEPKPRKRKARPSEDAEPEDPAAEPAAEEGSEDEPEETED